MEDWPRHDEDAEARTLLLTLGMGFVGGLFPAIRAARLPIAQALREA